MLIGSWDCQSRVCRGCCAPHGENSCTGFHRNTTTDESESSIKVHELHKHIFALWCSSIPLDPNCLIMLICKEYSMLNKTQHVSQDTFFLATEKVGIKCFNMIIWWGQRFGEWYIHLWLVHFCQQLNFVNWWQISDLSHDSLSFRITIWRAQTYPKGRVRCCSWEEGSLQLPTPICWRGNATNEPSCYLQVCEQKRQDCLH